LDQPVGVIEMRNCPNGPVRFTDSQFEEARGFGKFSNDGRAWADGPPQVDEHDFHGQAEYSAQVH
jgi:hypothetical protein